MDKILFEIKITNSCEEIKRLEILNDILKNVGADASFEKEQSGENFLKNTFKITHGEDTRDGSELWVVRIEETLTKDEYIRINKAVKDLGGYYSKFKHGFIFRFEPSEALKKIA